MIEKGLKQFAQCNVALTYCHVLNSGIKFVKYDKLTAYLHRTLTPAPTPKPMNLLILKWKSGYKHWKWLYQRYNFERHQIRNFTQSFTKLHTAVKESCANKKTKMTEGWFHNKYTCIPCNFFACGINIT